MSMGERMVEGEIYYLPRNRTPKGKQLLQIYSNLIDTIDTALHSMVTVSTDLSIDVSGVGHFLVDSKGPCVERMISDFSPLRETRELIRDYLEDYDNLSKLPVEKCLRRLAKASAIREGIRTVQALEEGKMEEVD
jgi:hypothetical protein